MNWWLGAEVAAYLIWILSNVYHRRDVRDERGNLVVLKSNNFAYVIVLLGLSAVILVGRFDSGLSKTTLVIANSVVLLAGLVSSAIAMFVYNKTE